MSSEENGFIKFSAAEFITWIKGISVSRTVSRIQHHHTFIPRYRQFDGSNHFELQKNMRNHHVTHNGWSDIGQHFSVFPDGMIVTGRTLNQTPACIYGANSRAICIENIGNFDEGEDTMEEAQKHAIVAVTAAIINRFPSIACDDKGIIYHHWFDLSTGARRDGEGTTKSCPGTAFFGGNKVENFNEFFLPLVKAQVNVPDSNPGMQNIDRFVVVTASYLNIRTGPGSRNKKITEHGPAERGSILRVTKEENGWLKISNSKNHWVFGRYTQPVTRGVINTDGSEVFEGPGTEYDVLETLDKGDDVYIHTVENSWLNIGPARWIKNSLVT